MMPADASIICNEDIRHRDDVKLPARWENDHEKDSIGMRNDETEASRVDEESLFVGNNCNYASKDTAGDDKPSYGTSSVQESSHFPKQMSLNFNDNDKIVPGFKVTTCNECDEAKLTPFDVENQHLDPMYSNDDEEADSGSDYSLDIETLEELRQMFGDKDDDGNLKMDTAETRAKAPYCSPVRTLSRRVFQRSKKKMTRDEQIDIERQTERTSSLRCFPSLSNVTPHRKSAIGFRHGLSSRAIYGRDKSFGSISRRWSRELFNKIDSSNTTNSKKPEFSVENQEREAREKAVTHSIAISCYNLQATIKVFLYYLITTESVFTSLVSAGLTFYYWLDLTSDTPIIKNADMDKILLTFAVITPISVSVRLAFYRRERALSELAKFRSFAFQVYAVHCSWDWKTNGGRAGSNIDWLEHTDSVMSHLIGIGDELKRFLTLPTSSRGRHRFTSVGRKEAMKTLEVAFYLFDSLYTQRFIRLTMLTEILKTAGLSETETSRCRQYERYMGEAVENLRLIKSYRTPEALRTFARIFVVFLPPLYAPSFAQLGYNLNSLGIAIAFAIITSIGLYALFESVEVLEDPFVGYTELDGIDVEEELEVLHWQQLVNAREVYFPNAREYPSESNSALHARLKNIRQLS